MLEASLAVLILEKSTGANRDRRLNCADRAKIKQCYTKNTGFLLDRFLAQPQMQYPHQVTQKSPFYTIQILLNKRRE